MFKKTISTPLISSLSFALTLICFLFAPSATAVDAPPFERQTIDDDLQGDYWIQARDLNSDGRTDLVAVAWASGLLVWYENDNPTWTRHTIANVEHVVAFDTGDVNGDGKLDIIVAYNFTIPTELGVPSGGTVAWLPSPDMEAASNCGTSSNPPTIMA